MVATVVVVVVVVSAVAAVLVAIAALPTASAFPSPTLPRRSRRGLPVFVAAAGDDDNDDDNDNDDNDDPEFRRRNQQWVVLVDDEESIRYAVGDFLYDRGYEVTACADATSLLDLIAAKNVRRRGDEDEEEEDEEEDPRLPDVIVSDVRMPESDKNGYELVEFLRSSAATSAATATVASPGDWAGLNRRSRVSLSNLPIVLLTGKAMTEDRIRGYRAGADVVLPKPFSPEELVSILDNLIRLRQHRLRPRQRPAAAVVVGGDATLTAAATEDDLRELKREIDSIQAVVSRNASATVRKTDVVLADRERRIAELLAEGMTAREIAASLRKPPPSNGEYDDDDDDPQPPPTREEIAAAKAAIKSLREKTGSATKTEFLRWARRVGYLPEGGP